jgi:osmotically-inducible protein OsmY
MKRTRSIYSLGTLMFIAAMSGCATHKPCSESQCTADQQTTESVKAALSTHSELAAPCQIQVSSRDHVVYLSGIVYTGYQRAIAESAASGTDGVTTVVNSIGISK